MYSVKYNKQNVLYTYYKITIGFVFCMQKEGNTDTLGIY